MSSRWLLSLLIFSLALPACTPAPLPISNPAATTAVSLRQFYMQVALQEGFRTAQVAPSLSMIEAVDQAFVDQARDAFAADLRAGNMDLYRRDRSFSLQLLAGSEGSYLLPGEIFSSTADTLLATLVIVDQSARVFKGEFQDNQFYFADPSQQLQLAGSQRAYLLTADSAARIQTVRGELLAGSEGSYINPLASDLSAPSTNSLSQALVNLTNPGQGLVLPGTALTPLSLQADGTLLPTQTLNKAEPEPEPVASTGVWMEETYYYSIDAAYDPFEDDSHTPATGTTPAYSGPLPGPPEPKAIPVMYMGQVVYMMPWEADIRRAHIQHLPTDRAYPEARPMARFEQERAAKAYPAAPRYPVSPYPQATTNRKSETYVRVFPMPARRPKEKQP
jgi:hypothetical protein